MTLPGDNISQPAYITAASTAINDGNEATTLCDIKLLCAQRKKRCKRHIYLTFTGSSSVSTTNEPPCIEILGQSNISPILLDECISFEYFDLIKNDFHPFIYVYFQSYTVSIYFSNEHINKKPSIIKHLDYMYQKNTEITQQPPIRGLPCLPTTELILHTFDVKLIPYGTIISRDHNLLGHVRLYFTTSDLYITSMDCNREELKTTITNQCSLNDKDILCIPYFTIKHYGNQSNIFLIELGKSTYGDGEIHMKCFSSLLAKTIHSLASPVIAERPVIITSAFQNQLLTKKRVAKSKSIGPPIQLNHDTTNQLTGGPSISFVKKHSVVSISDKSTEPSETKSRSIGGFFRKLLKDNTPLRRSGTFDSNRDNFNQRPSVSPSIRNKFAELNIQENNSSHDQNRAILLQSPTITDSLKTNEASSVSSLTNQQSTAETYIDMGLPNQKSDVNSQEENMKDEEIIKELLPARTRDIGVNTTITLPTYIRSAIIVGTSVHLIAEEKAVFPIGQRSFTSPASVMQPFKAQLSGQTTSNNCPTLTDMIPCAPNSSSSFHHPTSASNSQQSLLVSYGIVTFNNASFTTDVSECLSNALSDGCTIDRRLNSDLSLMSLSHQQQPSNIYSVDNILSSSTSSSHIFRALSLSTNNIGDNRSGSIRTPHGSIIFLEENLSDPTTTYLLGPAPPLTLIEDITNPNNLPRLSSVNLTTISRPHMDEKQLSSNDAYALVEPLSLGNSPVSSLSTNLNEPLISSEKSTDYVDLLLPSNTGDVQQELTSSDENTIDQLTDRIDEKNERSSTVFYTDIDFYQTQRRDRLVQFALASKTEDQKPPFVL